MVSDGNGRVKKIMALSIATLVMLLLSIVVVLVLFFYPFTPLTRDKVVLEQPYAVAGQTITYVSYFKKHTERVGSITRYLVSIGKDSTIILAPFGLADASPSENHKRVTVFIPKEVKPGRYKITWVILFDYFGIRQIRVTGETPEFMVKDREFPK